MSNLPWFIDLNFQILMQYCYFQHWTWLSPPDTSIVQHHSRIGPTTSFFLELLLIAFCSSPAAYGTPFALGAHLPVSYLFAFSYCSLGSPGKNTGMAFHFFLQWTTFCQNSSLWLVHLGWPCTAWLIASLSHASPFTTRLWCMKESQDGPTLNRVLCTKQYKNKCGYYEY